MGRRSGGRVVRTYFGDEVSVVVIVDVAVPIAVAERSVDRVVQWSAVGSGHVDLHRVPVGDPDGVAVVPKQLAEDRDEDPVADLVGVGFDILDGLEVEFDAFCDDVDVRRERRARTDPVATKGEFCGQLLLRHDASAFLLQMDWRYLNRWIAIK